MLVVITIIGLIMGLIGPRVLNYLSESKVKAARIQLQSFASALDLFYLDAGRFPSTAEGLAALVRQAPGVAAWNGPYLKGSAVPNDPWNHGYLYRVAGRPRPLRHHVLRVRRSGRRQRNRRRHFARKDPPQKMSEVDERGFTLLEMVCVLAIIALLTAVLLPFIPRETSRSRLQAYALQAATLLKADRNAAIIRQYQRRHSRRCARARDPFRGVAGSAPHSRRCAFRRAVAANLPAAGGAVDHQLFRQRHLLRRHHRADRASMRAMKFASTG